MSEPPIIPDADPGPEITGWHDSDVAGDRINLHQGPIIAGDPEGARVEVAETGLRAYDATGTETASIAGEGGEFVGGSFRTSDTLPGQVTLSDDAYVDVGNFATHPGLRITPPDMSDLVSPPGIGPNNNGFIITGGRNVSGGHGYSIYSPRSAQLRFLKGNSNATVSVSEMSADLSAIDGSGNVGDAGANHETAWLQSTAADGSEGFIQALADQAIVATRDPGGNYMSQIRSNGREAYLWSTAADGSERILSVDTNGVWVKTNKSGTWKHYNLEETAQDSGWQSITPVQGVSASDGFAWRDKGGVIWFRGFVSAAWAVGSNTIATGLPAEMRPAEITIRTASHPTNPNIRWRIDSAGTLSVELSEPVTGTVAIGALMYPLG